MAAFTRQCSRCMAEMPSGANYCTRCGQAMSIGRVNFRIGTYASSGTRRAIQVGDGRPRFVWPIIWFVFLFMGIGVFNSAIRHPSAAWHGIEQNRFEMPAPPQRVNVDPNFFRPPDPPRPPRSDQWNDNR